MINFLSLCLVTKLIYKMIEFLVIKIRFAGFEKLVQSQLVGGIVQFRSGKHRATWRKLSENRQR